MVPVTPDLLTHNDGAAVTGATWPLRRRELYDAIVPHEYGRLPPPGTGTEALLLGSQTLRDSGVRHQVYEVRTVFAEGGEHSFPLRLWLPPGDGPFPVVLNGDGCWRYFDDAMVSQVVRRGYAAASFDRTWTAADNRSLYRRTGLYRLFPEAPFGALAAWAWAYHRCVDALTELAPLCADQVAITGHSRGGKAVLLAGATDDRVALVNPNDSGIGGSGLNRWKAAGAEVVDDFIRVGSIFWFGPAWAEYQHRDRALPYDQHFLHALVAPRALLVNEAYGDPGANPPGSYAACQAALRVYDLLSAGEQLGWAVRDGVHGHQPEDFAALLDFADWRFRGVRCARSFQRQAFVDLGSLLG